MVKEITKELGQSIIDDYISGSKMIDIAKKYDLTDVRVLNYLKRTGYHRPKNKRWDALEIELLQLNYSNLPWEDLLKLFPNRNKNDLAIKASELKIKRDTYFWIKSDEDFLKNNYGKYTSIELSQMLGKKYTPGAIKCKAKKMGLCYLERWTDDEINILKNNYSTKPLEQVIEMLNNKTYSAILGQAKKYNLISYFNVNTYYSKEQDDFIITNWKSMSNSEIGNILKKDSVSIMNRKHMLGLYVINKDYSQYTDLSKLFRSKLTDWKNDSMKQCDYKCIITGSKNFAVHHLYGFNMIVQEVYEELTLKGILKSISISDYSKEELDYMIDIFKEIHNKYPLGICVRKDIHDLFHRQYGIGGNTSKQWENFYKNYLKSEYVI